MFPSSRQARVVRVLLILESGETLRRDLGLDNHAFMRQQVNHRVMGNGLGRYNGGEFIETTVHWVEPDEVKISPAIPDEPVRDGEDYVPIVESDAE